MARVWFLVIVSIQIVFAKRNLNANCDMCIQKGGYWCKLSGVRHLVFSEFCFFFFDFISPMYQLPEISVKFSLSGY